MEFVTGHVVHGSALSHSFEGARRQRHVLAHGHDRDAGGNIRQQEAGEEAMNTADAEARAQIRQFMPPLMIMFVSIPLMLGWIPRNGFYGIRVREAFASDASWYAINRLGSIALVGASLVWLAAAAYAPRPFVKPIGITAMLLAFAALVLSQGWTL
jgi:hypothetical protein